MNKSKLDDELYNYEDNFVQYKKRNKKEKNR